MSEAWQCTRVRRCMCKMLAQPNWRPASSLTDESSLEHVPYDAMDVGREIFPFEAIVCRALIADLRRICASSSPNIERAAVPIYGLPGGSSADVETAIRKAASTIRFNAKWFAPSDLAELLDIALQAASRTSSGELYAGLRLLDVAGTYAVLPPESLPGVARFLAQAFYSASRAQKTRRTAAYAWTVSLNIFKSHLGYQLIGALFTAMTAGDETKGGFAATAGALLLLSERLKGGDNGLPIVNVTILISRLQTVAAASSDLVIIEHISTILTEVLAVDGVLHEVRQNGGDEAVLDVLMQCCKFPSRSTLGPTVQRLASSLSGTDPRLLPVLAWLHVATGLALPDFLWPELLVQYHPFEAVSGVSGTSFDKLVQLMCAQGVGEGRLASLINRSTLAYHLENASSQASLPTIVDCYVRHIADASAAPQARRLFAEALAIMFLDSAGSATAGSGISVLLDGLCAAALNSEEAASFLFRIRADITGAVYVTASNEDGALGSTGVTFVASTPTLQAWFATLLTVFSESVKTWEVLDCFLSKTKHLLGNHAFFTNKLDFIIDLQKLVQDNLDGGIQTDPPPYTGYSKAYVAAQLVQTLTVSLSYHRQLSKEDVVRLVSVFTVTAGSRDSIVSIQCIHALTICCYEVPDIMSKYMEDVINKMSRLVTQRYLAIHVLQFLTGLSRLPYLYRNFTETDYKKIFAVCYSYLQSSRGQQGVVERRQTPTSERSSSIRNEEALPEYVYALAHHVITFWYMSLKRQDRQTLKPYITSCLTFEVDGKECIEDQGMVIVDMMDRVDAEDSSEDLLRSPTPFTPLDGPLSERHRLIGLLLVSTKTALRTKRTLVTVRRPSGIAQRWLKHGRSRVTVASEDNYITVLPDDVFGHTYGSVAVPKPSSALGSLEIITLPDEDAVRRAIEALDRTSALDSHKAGVIYIGEKQTTEESILLNVSGSPDFRDFVRDLGELELLKGATFNTQGLDRADDGDGQHVMVWHNKVTEVVFHVTTMMPNSADRGENTARKKRHVGNDHVNIVFNNSGRSLDFNDLYNIFPGQLTYVYILISPSARTSFVEARTEKVNTDRRDRFYRVHVVARPDYPNISSAAEEKVVSGASLPGMVRNLALNECIMTLMWTQRSDSAEYPSSWRSRLHQLRRLADRYKAKWA